VLPPSRALWIPAGTAHETIASERSMMRTLYLEPELSPIDWTTPRPLIVTTLLTALIEHLSNDSHDGHRGAWPRPFSSRSWSRSRSSLLRSRFRETRVRRESPTRLSSDPGTPAPWRTGGTRSAPARARSREFLGRDGNSVHPAPNRGSSAGGTPPPGHRRAGLRGRRRGWYETRARS
jgi:hypothetical protein